MLWWWRPFHCSRLQQLFCAAMLPPLYLAFFVWWATHNSPAHWRKPFTPPTCVAGIRRNTEGEPLLSCSVSMLSCFGTRVSNLVLRSPLRQTVTDPKV